MATKTIAFATRNNNKTKIRDLWAMLNQLWDENSKAYDDYISALESFLREHPYTTADQIANALSDSISERNSIKTSIAGLDRAAQDTRHYEEKEREWNALTPEEQAKQKKLYPFSTFPDSKDFRVPLATVPSLNHKEITKTRHFVELDDDDKEISRYDTIEKSRVYYLEANENEDED